MIMVSRSRWYTSDRCGRLPANWEAVRRKVAERAHYECQATVHAAGCNGVGTDCDHIIPGDNHNLDNLQWLSAACHKAKTARESAERNIRRKKMRLHPCESHPGLM